MLIVGTLVFVLGVAFFVKYAFDNHWINERARVAIGTAAGIAAWIAGLRFASAGYQVYGRILSGGGLGIVYMAAYAASALYAIVPPAFAFAWMAFASAVTTVTADRQRSVGLASTAIVLAYAAPFLVGSDADRHVLLFVFDAMLASTTLVLVRRHGWPAIGPTAFWLTWTTFALWWARYYTPTWYPSTELYLTAVTAVFVAMRREYRRRGTVGAPALAALVLAIAPVAYYATSVAVLYDHSLWLLVFFIAFTAAAIGFTREVSGARLAIWAAVALPFFTWAGNHVMTAWYVATMVTAAAIYVLHLAAQFSHLQQANDAPPDAEIVLFHANGLGLFALTYLAVTWHSGSTASLALLLAVWHGLLAGVARRRIAVLMPHALALAFAFTAVAIAIRLSGPWMTVAWAAEGFAVTWIGLRLRQRKLRAGGAVLMALAVERLVAVQFGRTLVTFIPLLNSRTAAGLFIVGLMYGIAALYNRTEPGRERHETMTAWIVAAHLLTIGLMTADINSYWRLRDADVRASFARELSVSLAWGTYAMAVMALGFRRGSPRLRYLALGLFGATVGKMFLVDLLELGGIYRITGFVVLGLVLLAASFLYQRPRAREDYAEP